MSHRIEVTQPEEGVALVTVTDPARQNQLCWACVDELAERLGESRESGARIVVLASGLEGYWLQHAWLQDLADGVEGLPQTGSGMGWFGVQQELQHDSVVSIAAISGDTSGGGAELGWACDLRIAEQQARFAQPEVNMGLTTGIGGCSRLLRLAGRAATTEMVLTGRPFTASRLHALGAVNEVVPRGAAVATALQLASRLARKPASALAGLKRILAGAADMPLDDALVREQEVFQSVVVTDAARQGMRAMQEAYDAGASVAAANDYAAWEG
ncbi:MAG: enoyl-CoA hydratase-related protein [Halioglobus sp.]|nr:enoyl-CoA hydratase-related protein [Halioglobus sp.]